MPNPGYARSISLSTSPPAHLREETVEGALLRHGLERTALRWPELSLAEGQSISFPADAANHGAHTILETASLAQYKQWIGLDDAAIREGREQAAAYDAAALLTLEELFRAGLDSPAGRTAIATATFAFLYGDSARVARLAPVIERHFGTFRAQLVTASRIELPAGATLAFDELPAVIVADELVFRGGSLDVRAGCRATFGRVVKEEETR